MVELFKPGQLISPQKGQKFQFDFYHQTHVGAHTLWVMSPPHAMLKSDDAVMFMKLLTKEFSNGYVLHKMVVFHDERLWASKDWFQTNEITQGWKVKP